MTTVTTDPTPPPGQGILSLPGFEDLDFHGLADWLDEHKILDELIPPPGHGLNIGLMRAAIRARELGLTDEAALCSLLETLAVRAGRPPETAKAEARRASVRSDGRGLNGSGSGSGAMKIGKLRPPPDVIRANIEKIFSHRSTDKSKSWTSPDDVPGGKDGSTATPGDHMALILNTFYKPTDILSIQPAASKHAARGREGGVPRAYTKTVCDLIMDGPPAPGHGGVWWRANVLKEAKTSGKRGSATDADIDPARCDWLLIECDDVVPIEHQIPLYLSVGLQPHYVVFSGSVSMQASVRVWADTPEEYTAIARTLLGAMAKVGVDPVNINVSRLRRMPGCVRPDGLYGPETIQSVVYIDTGAPAMTMDRAQDIADRIEKMIEAGAGAEAENEGDSTAPPEIETSEPVKTRFRLKHHDEIEYTPGALAVPVVEGMLSRNTLAVLFGPPGCGKSFLAIELALVIAAGQTWREGIPDTAPHRTVRSPVLYIALEGEVGAIKRVHAAKHALGTPAGTPFVLSNMPLNLQSEQSLKDFKALVDSFKEDPRLGAFPGVIIIDTLARAIGGNENDFLVMDGALRVLAGIQRYTKALVLVIHHTGKDATKGARGHSALLGAADTMLEIIHGANPTAPPPPLSSISTEDPESDNEDNEDPDPEEYPPPPHYSRSISTLLPVKQKDDMPIPAIPFMLSQVTVGPGYWPDAPETTCIVQHLPPSMALSRDGELMTQRRSHNSTPAGQRGKTPVSAAQQAADIEKYNRALAHLPQDSVRKWARAAGYTLVTFQRLLGRIENTPHKSHVKDENGHVQKTVDMLPEGGENHGQGQQNDENEHCSNEG
jgi:hypothetical protein